MAERAATSAEPQPVGLTRLYIVAWFVLIALTALEVLTVLVFHMPPVLRVTILLILALMKASLIGAYYMGLRFERLAMVYVSIIPLMLLALMLISILPDAASLLKAR